MGRHGRKTTAGEPTSKKLKNSSQTKIDDTQNKMDESSAVASFGSILSMLAKMIDRKVGPIQEAPNRKLDDAKNKMDESNAVAIESLLTNMIDRKVQPNQEALNRKLDDTQNQTDKSSDVASIGSIESLLAKMIDRKVGPIQEALNRKLNESSVAGSIGSMESILNKIIDRKMSEFKPYEFICPAAGNCVCCMHWSEHYGAVRGRFAYNRGGRGAGRSRGRGFSYY